MRILLVEDDPASRRLVLAVLEPIGYRVTATGSLAEARQALTRYVFDLVLLDLELPDGSGMELAHDIYHTGCPILIVTAYADQMSRLDRTRCDLTLTKPVHVEQLRTTVNALVGFRQWATEEGA
ncbi:MAG: response regulator [Candidatus Xenobia bacterium]